MLDPLSFIPMAFTVPSAFKTTLNRPPPTTAIPVVIAGAGCSNTKGDKDE
jgi:hypothetical protein